MQASYTQTSAKGHTAPRASNVAPLRVRRAARLCVHATAAPGSHPATIYQIYHYYLQAL